MPSKPTPKPERRRTFLRQWREFRNLTQDQAVERLIEFGFEITQGQLSRIERGESPYGQDFLEIAAQAYNCDPADLLIRDPADKTAPWSLVDNLKSASPELRRQAIAVVETLLKTGSR